MARPRCCRELVPDRPAGPFQKGALVRVRAGVVTEAGRGPYFRLTRTEKEWMENGTTLMVYNQWTGHDGVVCCGVGEPGHLLGSWTGDINTPAEWLEHANE